MSKRRYALFCAVAAVGFGAALGAKAQEASGNAQQTNGNDVVVTAQRRAERLQDVPQSVQAITANDLSKAGVTQTTDLTLLTPGLRMDAGGTYIEPAIRGVSTTELFPTVEANVATYVDGVYQANALNGVYQLPDVRDIEVLKGPQGTLFGRNATGGAILINTLQPDLSKATGMVSAGYGNFNTYTLKGVISAPIIQDRLAVSLAGFYEKTDGWVRNLLLHNYAGAGDETLLLRGKVRFKPWVGADFTLTGLYARNSDPGGVDQEFYQGNSLFRGTPGVIIASQPWTSAHNVASTSNVNTMQVSLRGNIEAGPGTITTTTAYSRTTSYSQTDADWTSVNAGSFPFQATFENFSQELVYSTKQIGRFHGTAGVFYFSSDGGLHPIDINVPNFAEAIWTNDKDQSYAIFGEGTFDVTDKLSVTGGLRYSYEHRDAYANVAFTMARPPLPLLGSANWGSVTPRVSLLYKATADTNVYFTFSQGFKGGIFNTTSFQTAPVNPEKITAYEGGIKSTPLPNLSLTAAAFYYDYTNLQVTTISESPGGGIIQFLSNAAKAQIYGLEFDGSWRPVDALKLTFGASYLHAVYSSFPAASINVPAPFVNPACSPFQLTGNCTILRNVSGNTMIRSPTFSANLTAQYTWNTSMGRVDLSGTVFYTTKIFFEFGDRVVQPGYEDINASLAWRPYDKGLQIRVWAKNLTNRAVISQYVGGVFGDNVIYAPPRTFGAELSYEF